MSRRVRFWDEQINEVLDFFSLTINLFISHHVDTSSRSLLIELVTSLTVTLEQYKVYHLHIGQRTELSTCNRKSLICIRNKRMPRMDPCGITYSIGHLSDTTSFTDTCWKRLFK